MSKRTTVLVFAAVVLGLGVASAGQAPLAVSPGDPEELALVEARCPTFSWAAVDGAESYELVVYAVGPHEADTEPVLVETLAGGVTGWTPSLGRCLERGGSYAWSVRARRPKGLTEWSAAAFFQVASGPSESEYRQMLEVVQRYLAAEAARAGLGDGMGEADSRPAGQDDAEVATRATSAPGPNTKLLVEDGHIAVRGDGGAFVQLDTRQSAPHVSYCDQATETGRMIVRVGSTRRLYICTTNGVTPSWKSINLP